MYSQESLRGYAYSVHKRDGFQCVYCGWDGSKWPNWLFLSRDHLLPHGDPNRADEKYIVTPCRFCNECHNKTVFDVRGKSKDDIIKMKKKAILERRTEFQSFWSEYVDKKHG